MQHAKSDVKMQLDAVTSTFMPLFYKTLCTKINGQSVAHRAVLNIQFKFDFY